MGLAAIPLASLFVPALACAQAEAPSASSSTVTTLLAVGALTLVPVALMTTTSYAKIAVVFSILKNALGVGEVPSGAVIVALSAILTLYVMAPVGARIAAEAGPAAEAIDPRDPLADLEALGAAVDAGLAPLRSFLARNAGERERALFLELAREADPDAPAAASDDLLVLLPSFLVTELSEAFQIGFLVFLPFLVVDLVVGNVLLSLGMHALEPTRIAMPFKLLLFVLVDGWLLLARALVLGYA